MTDSLDTDTLELRRIVVADPAHPGAPDLPVLLGAGRRRLVRRRAAIGGAALGAAAAIVVPALLLAGGPGDSATGPDRGGAAGPPDARSNHGVAEGAECGVLSCIEPGKPGSSREPGKVVGELSVGTLPSGAEEVVYVVNTEGVDLTTNEDGRVDVLKAGYRVDGTLYSTLWALQPGYDGDNPNRFWYNPGFINAPLGSGGHYVVVGYVDGTPAEISWSTPDGDSGTVDGTKVVDGRTIFYLTRPLPADYEPPPSPRTDKDTGSFRISDLTGETFTPDLTIRTSDGWSCSLADCGSTG